jgi:tRNA(fMet)-specific endonuclease VapC
VTPHPRARHQRGVLDTSTLILLTRIQDERFLPVEPLITTVTLAELSVGPLLATTDEERATRQSHVQQAEADFEPLPFDVPAARAFGRAALALRRSGRAVKPRTYDVMIAATALANGLPLYTCNPKDFAGVDGLTVVVVPVPSGPTREPGPSHKPRAKR